MVPFFDLAVCALEKLPAFSKDSLWFKTYPVLPLWQKGKSLYLAMEDTANCEIVQAVQFHTGCQVFPVKVDSDRLQSLRNEMLDGAVKTIENIHDSAIDWVEDLLDKALRKGASDIHFEPYEKYYRVRFRLDGLLSETGIVPAEFAERIIARFKVMAHLDTAEKRIPQDGHFEWTHSSSDCRVSVCPVIHGEKVVIRLMNHLNIYEDWDEIGLNEKQKNLFIKALSQPQGMILVTGPTGSGKTMTLYTALNYLNYPEKNIVSVEDPVEMILPGVQQVNVNDKIGLTFSRVLRSLLRQDPDIIMVGEIRDPEAARIAVSAAQTGHLVLSTLHTNSALESINRLRNMDIEIFEIMDAVKLVVAQRLVRKLCRYCRIPDSAVFSVCRQGCKECFQGYKGRIGIFEVLPVSAELIGQIVSGSFSSERYPDASLWNSGLEKVNGGLTTLEEVERVAGSRER